MNPKIEDLINSFKAQVESLPETWASANDFDNMSGFIYDEVMKIADRNERLQTQREVEKQIRLIISNECNRRNEARLAER